MSASGCGDASALQGTAAELFQLAALLMADQAEAVSLVEETLSLVEVDPCLDPAATRKLATEQVLTLGLRRLRHAEPESFDRVPDAANSVCVEDEDLSAAGVSQAEVAEWLADGGRQDLREWLRALPAAQRAVFVQRAMLGQGNVSVAEALDGSGDESAHWSAAAVGELYRLALCSLANSLAHSPGVMAQAGTHSVELSA